MAKNFGHNDSTSELTDEVERSRRRVSRTLSGLRDELDLPKKIRRSFQHHPAVWIGVALVAGLLYTMSSSRKQTVYVDRKGGKKNKILEAGFVLGSLRIAATLLKPFLMKLAAQKMSDYARSRRSDRF